jgi:hypothetical protein
MPDSGKDLKTHCLLDDGGFIVRSELVPWTRLEKPGLEAILYKILAFDENTGYMVLLNTFDPNSKFPPHKHLGAVDIFMLSGSFYYDNGKVYANDFMREAGGNIHAPASDEGALMLAIFHGPLQIIDDQGNGLMAVGIDDLYKMAEANGAVGHLQRRKPRVAMTPEG